MALTDVICVGLGAVGSATAYQLAKRGARVLGIDRHRPPHAFGSSHGGSRITRLAIGEGDAYVPLALRSHEIWREVEAATGEALLVPTGGLWISSPRRQAETHVANFFDNTVAAARRFGIRHELLQASDIRARFPQFAVAGNEVGYYEPEAGYLRPEACIAAQLALAQQAGAELRYGERVEAIEPRAGHVEVRTDQGRYTAGQVIVAAGAALHPLLPAPMRERFTITRQLQYWFDVAAAHERFVAPRFPVFIWELQDRKHVIYGIPAIDGPAGGLKIATEQYTVALPPDGDPRPPPASHAEIAYMKRELVAPYLPGVGARCLKVVPCVYTATPDFHFAVGPVPGMPGVTLASACSGHGFKHSAALGEALAQQALGGRSEIPFPGRVPD